MKSVVAIVAVAVISVGIYYLFDVDLKHEAHLANTHEQALN